jgi:hypothetical protein
MVFNLSYGTENNQAVVPAQVVLIPNKLKPLVVVWTSFDHCSVVMVFNLSYGTEHNQALVPVQVVSIFNKLKPELRC